MGLQPAPLIFAIKQCKSEYAVFIGTKGSLNNSLDRVVEDTDLKASCFDKIEISDSPDAIGELCSAFDKARQWLMDRNVAQSEIVADPTGGRKWMSSGATMAASFLGISMIYVDVDYKNQKPDPDSMRVVSLGNAYDQTGFIVGERGRLAFNSSNFDAAMAHFDSIRPTLSHRAEFFISLKLIAASLSKWDKFEHYGSTISGDFEKGLVLLERALKTVRGREELFVFHESLKKLRDAIAELEGGNDISVGFIVDLYLNAKRRRELHRFDDAVARFYRTLEAISQYLLKKELSIASDAPDYKTVSETAKSDFLKRSGLLELPVKLDLKKSFILLDAVGCDLVSSLFKGPKKAFTFEKYLAIRNSSILAHGFKPVGQNVSDKFLESIEVVLEDAFGQEYIGWKERLVVPEMPALGF